MIRFTYARNIYKLQNVKMGAVYILYIYQYSIDFCCNLMMRQDISEGTRRKKRLTIWPYFLLRLSFVSIAVCKPSQ
jgi:hypothetical protein